MDEKEKLVVVSNINLQNIEKKGMIKVVGVINGEDFVKNIPLDKIDETTKKLKVNFVTNKNNEFVSADKRDEFFVCAYHYTNTNDNNNNIKSKSFNKQNDATTTIDYFDCNEADIQSTTSPTEANLFKVKSQVYNKSFTYYNFDSKANAVSFDTIGNNTNKSTTNNFSNSNVKEDNKKVSNTRDDNNSNKPVKIKIIVPMEDRKDAKKIKIIAMLKGQIKSEIIDSVQEEFKKIG